MSLLLLLGPHGPLFWWVHAISVALNSLNMCPACGFLKTSITTNLS